VGRLNPPEGTDAHHHHAGAATMTTTIETRWAGTFEVTLDGRTVTTLYTRLNGEVEEVYTETFGSTKRAAKVYEIEIKAVKRANRNN
jgi:hypothetical protein